MRRSIASHELSWEDLTFAPSMLPLESSVAAINICTFMLDDPCKERLRYPTWPVCFEIARTKSQELLAIKTRSSTSSSEVS